MAGDGNIMVFPICGNGESLMTAGLVIDTVPIAMKKSGEVVAIDIPW